MADPSDTLENRAHRYATARHLVLEDLLGYGKDGMVYSTNQGVAVKVYGSVRPFIAERNCYLRLAEREVEEVLGHNIPQMLAWSNVLQVIEMTIVQPPFLLDFASAHLDIPPEFPEDVMLQWEQDRMEEFKDHWPRVRLIIDYMADQYGIYLTDIHPRNIAFD